MSDEAVQQAAARLGEVKLPVAGRRVYWRSNAAAASRKQESSRTAEALGES